VGAALGGRRFNTSHFAGVMKMMAADLKNESE
jgi:hypothetical protein